MNNFFYKVNDQEYEVVVTTKRIKNVHYRYKNGKFYVSCNRFTSQKFIQKGLDKFALKLIKSGSQIPPIGEDYLYLFGHRYDLVYPGRILINGYPEIKFNNQEQLEKKLRPIFLDFIIKRVRYYQKEMGVPEYKVGVRKMSTRYGSNSKKTKHLNFALVLIHYSVPIIDSVVVHELAHIKEFNHSKKFYDVVYKYCPDYDKYRRDLIKGVYHD